MSTFRSLPSSFSWSVLRFHAGIPNRPEDPTNLFRIAIAFEKRAVTFFSERCELAPKGSTEYRLYQELAAEEREHVAILEMELEQWKLGKAGLL